MSGIPTGIGTALADRYRIERELGAGGMATVYLAEDLKHDRKVAIKVLRPELAAVIGAERFLREIKTIANLQHPHILGLIDSGEVIGTAYYVMPFVEGESLRDRLNREKQLPVADAVRIATEVAGALDYAHRHGVIHRDIKPENVMVHDGSALVTDFGIALAVSSAGGGRMTETGMSLGTPHYMSPEQAMGEREITARSDVYALGVMMYEMLTGDPPFTGSTAQAIVARVLTEVPRPLSPQRHSIPPEVDEAVQTALEKLPADRFTTAAEFAAALAGSGARKGVSRRRDRAAATPFMFSPLPLIAGAILLGLGTFFLGRRTSSAPVLPMVFGSSSKVTWESGLEILPAISPDGKSVAYGQGSMFNMKIYVRPVAGGRSIRLSDDTAAVQSHPRWSPDGSRILFLAQGGVFSAPAAGGAARAEVPAGRLTPIITAAYSPDGKQIAYVLRDSLLIKEQDGNSRFLASFPEPNICSWSPNGALIACVSGNALSLNVTGAFGNISPSSIVVSRVSDGKLTTVTDSLTLNQGPVRSPDSHWLYFISDRHGSRDIYGQRISGDGQQSGDPVRLTTGLGAHTFSLSADGSRLAYSSLATTSNVWSVDLTGRAPTSLRSAVKVTSDNQNVETMNVSSDGQWLYYDSDLSGNMDLYRMRLPNGSPERLTTDPSDDFAPRISPDGKEVAFHSWRAGSSREIYVMPLDGGPVQRITNSPLQEALTSWSPDGNAIAFLEFTDRGGIWIARRTNGAWGTPVRRLDHGYWPNWSRDGKELVFSNAVVGGDLRIVPVDSGPERIVMDTAGGVLADLAFYTENSVDLVFRGSDLTGRRALYRLPVAGGKPQAVATLEEGAGSPIRGGIGYARGRAFFGLAEQQSDIIVTEIEPR